MLLTAGCSDPSTSPSDPPGMLKVTWPNGGETLYFRSEVYIHWEAEESSPEVEVFLIKSQTVEREMYPGPVGNDGNQSWVVPWDLQADDDYRIRIVSQTIPAQMDQSDSTFTIMEFTAPDSMTTLKPIQKAKL